MDTIFNTFILNIKYIFIITGICVKADFTMRIFTFLIRNCISLSFDYRLKAGSSKDFIKMLSRDGTFGRWLQHEGIINKCKIINIHINVWHTHTHKCTVHTNKFKKCIFLLYAHLSQHHFLFSIPLSFPLSL